MTLSHHTQPALLVLNPGSSSIKWSAHTLASGDAAGDVPIVASGQFNGDAEEGASIALAEALQYCDVCSVVIRFVHGGSEYRDPVLVDADTFQVLQQLVPLAPLHNNVALKLIAQLQRGHAEVPVVAVFDTEFFTYLPGASQCYGLPRSLIEKYKLRRYGFHGFAHRAMVSQWQALNPDISHYRLVTAQLGSGCSMAAIMDGKPIDTTMGFSPNEGLLMRTRSGDLDPGLLTWLQRQEKWSPEDTDQVLNKHSGWHGVSGGTDNMGELFASNDPLSREAFSLFCHRFQKTLGGYYAILGGLDGIILSGGIAENSAEICQKLLAGLSHMGIHLADSSVSADLPMRLTKTTSPVQCWSAVADEAGAMLASVQQRFTVDENHSLLPRSESISQ